MRRRLRLAEVGQCVALFRLYEDDHAFWHAGRRRPSGGPRPVQSAVAELANRVVSACQVGGVRRQPR
eukprot:10777850-Lingulodinium_polyedra.AAC.1